jgi:prepilin-type N-terminal cleavage/methylation domain-containing protein
MNARGFAMTEVLVALLVFGMALAGGLGLALQGFAATLEARRAQQAAALAADLAGRVATLPGVDWTSLPGVVPCEPACSPAQLAAVELGRWRALLATTLPAGTATLGGGASGTLLLQLEWTESGGAARRLELGMLP